jgi:ATP-dependent helicase HrpB
VDAEQAAAALAEAAAKDLPRALGLDRPEEEQWLARLASLAAWMPDLGLPTGDEAWVKGTLPILCAGKRSFADLQKAAHHEVWEGMLEHRQRQALATHAPERLAVPSGSQIRLTYAPGKAPVLAARIQELFGLATTPKVAGGRVSVLMHLLAPNGRPQQVTDDLASFWNVGYQQVRKELRARYPRHAWPEDPWTAEAQRRPRRRS